MFHKKAFTLVELLVAMAIIGVLIGLSLFGIAAAQRNARDTARRAATQDINAGTADYFSQTGSFPTGLGFNNDEVIITNPPATTCTAGVTCVIVPLDGAAKIGTSGVLSGTGGQLGSRTTDTSSWCYAQQSDGYSLGVLLESDEQFQAGTSITDCTVTAN
ncbi:MAG: type II secretion system protein [Candidatus Dojkabacteria bacterium]